MRFYYREEKQTRGPVSVAELIKLPGFGPDTLICPVDATDAADWKKASEHPKLMEAVESARAAKEKRAEERARAQAAKKCPSCGRANAHDAAYCDKCGAALREAKEPAGSLWPLIVGGALLLASAVAYFVLKR